MPGKPKNHIMPFLWLRGENEKTVQLEKDAKEVYLRKKRMELPRKEGIEVLATRI